MPPARAEHINRAPVITTGPWPAYSYAAFRNAPTALPILGAAPRILPLATAPGGALFRDPDGDPLRVRIVAPLQEGSAAVDPTTGAVVFRPRYVARRVPNGKVVQFKVQAFDACTLPEGLASETVTVNVTIGGCVRAASVRVDGFCSGYGMGGGSRRSCLRTGNQMLLPSIAANRHCVFLSLGECSRICCGRCERTSCVRGRVSCYTSSLTTGSAA